jgi:hypothetical protein
MPIRWSAVKVVEAMEKVKIQADQVIEPLKLAKVAIEQARKIDHLPEYMKQHLSGLEGEIERVTGGSIYPGNIHRAIKRVLDDIPEDAIDREQMRTKDGRQQTLIQ